MSHDLKQPHFIFAPDIELKLMKIIYSPEFEGHVFLGMDKEHDHIMDAMVCDTMGLVSMLELRLGIHHEDQSAHYRTVEIYERMSR